MSARQIDAALDQATQLMLDEDYDMVQIMLAYIAAWQRAQRPRLVLVVSS